MLRHTGRSFLKDDSTFGNKYVDEETKTSQKQSSHQTTPPAHFLQEEVGTDFHEKFHGYKDELSEVEV